MGLKLTPTDWLSLLTNYTLTTRSGYNNVAFLTETGEGAVPLTYKSYSGSLIRNNFNFIAEVYPVNNVTTSVNFSIYNDNFTDSAFGIQSDRGWSVGADVSWRPHDRVALSLGYDHQQLQTKTLTPDNSTTNLIFGESCLIGGDTGPTLTTSDSYDTFVARADIKLIPKKLFLTTRGSYSFSNSNFHNNLMTNLNEYYADINTFLTYKFDEHWACQSGIYIPGLPHEQRVRNALPAGSHCGGRARRAPAISSTIPWTGSTGTPRRIWCRDLYSTSFSLSLRVRWQE